MILIALIIMPNERSNFSTISETLLLFFSYSILYFLLMRKYSALIKILRNISGVFHYYDCVLATVALRQVISKAQPLLLSLFDSSQRNSVIILLSPSQNIHSSRN